MYLSHINIHSLRNIPEVSLHLHPRFNIFYGENGSGKTSLLESIHVLTTGKSFRTHHPDELIRFNASSFILSGMIGNPKENSFLRMGLERKRVGGVKIQVNNEPCYSVAELARNLPIQILNTDSYCLLEASPNHRRQFLDWGMFHVEHLFFQAWQRYKRALLQRNAALKLTKYKNHQDVHVWDQELGEAGELIDQFRKAYLEQWTPVFLKVIFKMLKVEEVRVQYNRGWTEKGTLHVTLKENTARDRLFQYTTEGPHRADLSFFIGGSPAKTVLSRGQLKLFICALFLARSLVLYEKTQRTGLFLVDDLSSELDPKASELFMNGLEHLKGQGQVIMTVIEKKAAEKLLNGKEYQMFHVEQGRVHVVGERETEAVAL